MRNILGGKEKACTICGATVVFLKVKRLGIVSQCKECGSTQPGRLKDEVKIYEFDEKGDPIND